MYTNIAQMAYTQAEKLKQKPAFRYIDSQTNKVKDVSWEAFASKSQQVSRALISLDYKPESMIGIFSHNRPEWTIADIGILAIRAVVVPFYATSNQEQLKYIVDETKMTLIFVDDEAQLEKALWLLDKTTLTTIVCFSAFKSNHKAVMSFEDFCKLGNEEDSKTQQKYLEAAKIDDLASIIYTSGTTGEPKGVMLSHLNFLTALKINKQRLNTIDGRDVSMAFLPLSHVFERSWTFFCLYLGITNMYLADPKKIIETMPNFKPTVMCVVPRFFEKTYDGIMEAYGKWSGTKQKIFDWSVGIGRKAIGVDKPSMLLSFQLKLANRLVLEKMRLVFGGRLRITPCAGAAINPKLLEFFHAMGIFVNFGYGATETTATVSCMKSDLFDLQTCGSIMPETKVTIGENEEIIIEGDTIFKGYYKKPKETAEVLNGKSFKSGDKGYITKDNYLVMTDRIKDLMKTSGGKYISPQKLELLLGENKYIDQLVVVGDNRRFVSALIVPATEQLKLENSRIELVKKGDNLLAYSPDVYDFYKSVINEAQKDLDSYEQIKKFILMPHAFSIESEELTNTLKVKRKFVTNKYKSIINEMYAK
ncbi:MAG: long-chain fatty acid--CoA ligase [Bacteroidales bacterium]|nr:long-chain fatty acid--CoA ligase [Bacteroidales bacterium]